jgi:FKBP-type peptidyl-prolyl cis-trans isomerase (trigger factor)
MGFTISEIGPCKKRAEFDLSNQEVLEGFDTVYGEICETISFPGFRKGKVPRALVAKKIRKRYLGRSQREIDLQDILRYG